MWYIFTCIILPRHKKSRLFFQLPHFPESDTISPESFLTIHKQECLIMEDKNPIQVADRLFLVLETLADTGSVTLAELCRQLGLNKSTLHRLLSSLIYMGYVKQDSETGKYSLTLKLLGLSNKLLGHMDILDAVRPSLKYLAEETGETVHFVQLEGTDAVYIYKEESTQNSVRMVSKVGSWIPLYCSGVGKAMAADMEEPQIQAIWDNSTIRKLTPHTIIDYNQFLEKIKEVREKGYALDDEENELGVRCIAVSIPDYLGHPKYAFSISAPVARMSDERILQLSAIVLKTKKEMLSAMS